MFRLYVVLLVALGASSAFNIDDKTVLNNIQRTLNRHEADINRLTAENKQLTETNKVLTQAHDITKEQVIAQGNEIEALKKVIATSSIHNQDWNANPTLVHSSQQSVQRNARLLLTPGLVISPNVAFTAKLGTHVTGLGNQQPLVFDTIETNQGNAYSPITGVFTAPINGTYFFTATIMSHYNDYLEMEIALNGNDVVHIYASDSNHEQGTSSVVLVLKEQDSVWVRHHRQEGNKVYGNNWSSFSGFLLYG